MPVAQVRARAVVSADPRGQPGGVHIQAPAIALDAQLSDLSAEHPLAAVISAVLNHLGVFRLPACSLRVTSTIPVAAGLGSGAAVSVAVIRAFAAFLGEPLADEAVSALAFEIERLYHGTPSGIDNTVITYARPVYFVRGQPIEKLRVAQPFSLVIGDTGIASPTSVAVGDVRRLRQENTQHIERLFDAMGEISQQARGAIEQGRTEKLGLLMNANHELLQEIGVSSVELDRLVMAARRTGAEGAKLSGGGRGGNMIALVPPEQASEVAKSLEAAGAVHTIITQVDLTSNST